MRFEEGRIDQFVSTRKIITDFEKNALVNEFQDRGSDVLNSTLDQIKNRISGNDDPSVFDSVKPVYTWHNEENQGNDAPSGMSEESDGKKRTIVPLIGFIVTCIVVFLGAVIGKPMIAFAGVFLGLAFLGFYSAIAGTGRGSTYYGGSNSSSTRKAGIILGIVGLAGSVPLFFYKILGTKGAFILAGAALFATVGLYLIIGFIGSLFTNKKKYTEKVDAECVGYSRIIETASSRTRSGYGSQRFRVMTSPVFEYTYQGRSYKAIYDRLIDGTNADVDMGPATIFINPDHPDEIGHKAPSVQVKGLLMGVVSIAVSAMLVFALINTDVASRENIVPGSSKGSINIFAFVFGSDEEKMAMMESIADGFDGLPGMDYPAEITDAFVDEQMPSYMASRGQWYYELAKIECIYEFDNNDYNIAFEDETFPQLCKSGNHDDIGDYRMVFYTVEEYEDNGETRIFKDVFMDLNPDEHSYSGTHGAYNADN